MNPLIPPLTKAKADWYRTEHNTASLIRTVAKRCLRRGLSGDQIWNLITLTWVSRNRRGVTANHWKKLKVPALESLFDKKIPLIDDDLSKTIDSGKLPPDVAQAAKRKTGMVNARGTWRKSSRGWCTHNETELTRIIRDAANLPANNQSRFDLAARIDRLPPVNSPNDKAKLPAARLLTPLIACLDPRCRFPILNGRRAVTSLLQKRQLAHADLAQQVKGLIAIIGQKDAFMLDVMTDIMIKRLPTPRRKAAKTRQDPIHETPLRNYDEEERRAVLASKTVKYRNRHNTMTHALDRIFRRFHPTIETSPAGRCDGIVKDYDGTCRDLLIEAKPDPDKGSLRIAIGQLFDYKRHRRHQDATDLAILTISRPSSDYVALLTDLGITALWFGHESCKRISGGEGQAWSAVARAFARKA
jgi:hypothetical protein